MDVVFRINYFRKFWFYCGVGVVIFVVGKFFVSIECSLDRSFKIWLWVFMGWIVSSIVMVYGLWYLFCKIKFSSMFIE